jgi:hypothetical protein
VAWDPTSFIKALETMISKWKGPSPMTFEIVGSLFEKRGSVVVTWPPYYDLSQCRQQPSYPTNDFKGEENDIIMTLGYGQPVMGDCPHFYWILTPAWVVGFFHVPSVWH